MMSRTDTRYLALFELLFSRSVKKTTVIHLDSRTESGLTIYDHFYRWKQNSWIRR